MIGGNEPIGFSSSHVTHMPGGGAIYTHGFSNIFQQNIVPGGV
jgi:predicted outer membrane repeat protein